MRRIARANLDRPSEILRRWWTKKYRLPRREFEQYTEEELWIEFYEDLFEANPMAAIELGMDDDDEEVQFVTGDPEFDKVEQMIADGASEEDIVAELEKWDPTITSQRERQASGELPPDDFEGFSEAP